MLRRAVVGLAAFALITLPSFAVRVKRDTVTVRFVAPPQVSIEGLDFATLRAELAYGDVEWEDPVQRQTTSICVPEGSKNVLKDAVEVPTHYLRVPYRVTGGVLVLRDGNGAAVHSARIDPLESNADYGYDSCAYWRPDTLRHDYRRDVDSFRRTVEETVRERFVRAAQAELERSLFFDVREEKIPLYRFRDKQHDYADVDRATDLARQAYADLDGNAMLPPGSAGRRALDEAVRLWRAALEESDLNDKSARINRKVASRLHECLGIAALMTGESAEAAIHFRRAETTRGMTISRSDGTGNADLLERARERSARARHNASVAGDAARTETLLAASEPYRGRIPIEVGSRVDVERLTGEHVAAVTETRVDDARAEAAELNSAIAAGEANPYEHFVTRTATQGFLLFLSSYQVRSEGFPVEVCRLDHLNQLRLRNHGFTTLCDDLGNLDALKVLDLKGNGIEQLPESIGGLQGLRKLELSNNAIRNLPESIGQLKELRVLTLKGNPLDSGEIERLERLLPRCKIKT